MIDLPSVVGGMLLGIVGTGIAVWNYARSRISPLEAQDIYTKTMKAVSSYRKAKEDGILTNDEMLKVAEESIEVIATVVKDLESEN